MPPEGTSVYAQSGVIPFRHEADGVKVLLITSMRRQRWIIPKGRIEQDKTATESAQMEAYEEAGIRGKIYSEAVGYYHREKWGSVCKIQVFLLEVEEVLDEWPEASFRERAWVSIDEAVQFVEEESLRKILRLLPAYIEHIKTGKMKRLYLIRHAKSSWKDSSIADFDRTLNKRGKMNAPFMGRQLKEYGVKADLVISSPANRALKTATLIAREIDFPKKKIAIDDSIYEADLSALVATIKGMDDALNNVILVGHNPAFTQLAEYLTNKPIDNIPTCGVFCVDFNIKSWKKVSKGKGVLFFFDYPKKHSLY